MAASADFEKPWARTVPARERPLADQAACVEVGGGDVVETGGIEGVQVDRLVLDPERVGEALQLRDPHVQRHLPALEVRGDVATGFLALGAATGGLAALAADAATDPSRTTVGPCCR